ncbi:tetratricopeptide repeat protein [Streptomyces sp. NPDC101206]|uniref:tetratricopeptide repeat protein n=1 Tax=Streptomyces sp. NPDC101206 TaxID=3366128 RepID=UPI00380874FF
MDRIDKEAQEAAPPPVTFTGRKTLVAAAVAVVLIVGALVIRPARAGDDARPPGPMERAASAVGTGAPAAVVDLSALIADREKWVAEHPRDGAAWAVLGSAYLEQARRTADPVWYPKAERALKRSLELRPAEKGNFDAMTGMGALANARGDYGTGRKWGELVRAQAPKQWTAYPVLVDAYSGLGDYPAAEKAMERLVEVRPGLTAHLKASQVYRDRGWREDAAVALERAAGAAKSPVEKAYVLYRRGELLWERGEPAEAMRQYEGALRADPAQADALGGRARALAGLGRGGEAVRDYRLALGRAQSPRLALELGELLESLGRGDEAKAPFDLLRAAAAAGGGNAGRPGGGNAGGPGGVRAAAGRGGVNDSVVLGLFEADHGDPGAAVRRLTAEWARHKNVQVADALGWALHRLGDDAAALEYARKAADRGLRSADFAYHRAVIEQGLGDDASARRHFQEAVRTNPRFSPVRGPLAAGALAALGEPPPGGPENVQPTAPWVMPVLPKPSASTSASASASASPKPRGPAEKRGPAGPKPARTGEPARPAEPAEPGPAKRGPAQQDPDPGPEHEPEHEADHDPEHDPEHEPEPQPEHDQGAEPDREHGQGPGHEHEHGPGHARPKPNGPAAR